MQLNLGDLVYNLKTGEEGQIARVVDRETYVVTLAPGSSWGITPKESLWKLCDITRNPNDLNPLVRKLWARST